MSESSTDCRQRAAALRLAYGESPLANVRGRYEQAAAKWDAMAVQAERTEKGRLVRAEKLIEVQAAIE
jgi:hypothetical protein